MNEFDAMLKSSTPAASSCAWLTCGPPGRRRHVEPVLLVDAGRDRLIEAAVLGLGLPVRAEIDGLGGARRAVRRSRKPAAANRRGRDQCSRRSNHQITLRPARASLVRIEAAASSIVPRRSRKPRCNRCIVARKACAAIVRSRASRGARDEKSAGRDRRRQCGAGARSGIDGRPAASTAISSGCTV